MAREYGKIPTGWWARGAGKRLRGNPAAQLVALYLGSCPTSSMIGLYYLPLVTLCHETGLPAGDVESALARLAELDLAHYDATAELVWVPGMAEQEIGAELDPRDKRTQGIRRELAAFRGHPFYAAFVARYGAAFQVGDLAPPSQGHPSPLEAPSKALGSHKHFHGQDQEQEHASHVRAHEAPPERFVEPDPPAPAAPSPASKEPPDLIRVAEELAAEQNSFGQSCAERIAQGRMLTPEQRKRLRAIAAERADTSSRPRAPPRAGTGPVQRGDSDHLRRVIEEDQWNPEPETTEAPMTSAPN